MKKFLALASAVCAMLAAALLWAPAASAGAYGCGGSEVGTYPVDADNGVRYGWIHVYYDSSTGKNCAVNVATSAGGYGKAKRMYMHLMECSSGSVRSYEDCRVIEDDTDVRTDYKYYAGPVSVTAPDHCLIMTGSISYNGQDAIGRHGPVLCS
ncbi:MULTISPECIES: hypothetical protein [unclassified Streptomyces]|uniref:hypothetical protein n=1 Tax=unclassified Streptomyces TaxID=2593676 RepID=UPI0033CE0ED7